MRRLRGVNTPLGSALCVFVAYGLFILARLWGFGGDLSRFALASAHFIPAQSAHAVGLAVQSRGYGYDGQFYYLLALNPFSPHPALAGAHFDLPAYRAQRILYPLVVWALSLGGRPSLVPIILVMVNLLAVTAIGAIGALLARRLGASPLFGLLLAFYPGLLVSVAGDLAEPLAMACALGAILWVWRCSRPRWGWAALLLSLAVLARETTTLIALALVVSALLARYTPLPTLRLPALRMVPRAEWRGALLAGLAPLAVALGWQGVLLLRWGELGLLAAGGNNLGAPLVGLIEGAVAWSVLWSPWMQALHYAFVAYLLMLAEATRRRLWGDWRRVDIVAVAWVLSLGMTLCLTVFVWDYYWSFLRGVIELAMFSVLLLLTGSAQARRILTFATLALWAVAFVANLPRV